MSTHPCPIFPTYMGHLLYSPSDLHDHDTSSFTYGLVDVADVIEKDFGVHPISAVMKVPQNIKSVFSFRSIFGAAVNCDGTGLSVQSRSGRRKITIDGYLQRALIDKPTILVALADEVGPNVGHNRRRKAFERTWQWFTRCKQFLNEHQDSLSHCQLFGVVLNDAANPTQLRKMTLSMLENGVNGIVFGGWYSSETRQMRLQMVQEVRGILHEKNLPKSFPLMIQGIDTLDQIKECLSLGIDFIATNYPQRQMKKGFAFCPKFHIDDIEDTVVMAGKKRARDIEESEAQQDKKAKFADGVAQPTVSTFCPPSLNDEDVTTEGNGQLQQETLPTSVAGASVKAEAETDNASMNLWRELYRKDTSILQLGCQCHSCANDYTRSYIHHLLKSRELLADVLLYQHNQFQLKRLFNHITLRRQQGESIEDISKLLGETIPVHST